MSGPVVALDSHETSGTPRICEFGPGAPGELPTYELPAGSTFWYPGRPNQVL